MSIKTENTPNENKWTEGMILRTKFGGLSRGKCWGKYYPNKKGPTGDFEWCPKDDGTLHLPGPGFYQVGSSDGFARKAAGSFYLVE